jgi:NADH:ubiquinone oxidoreductase subunit E
MDELALKAIIQRYGTSEEGLVEILREASHQAGYLTPAHLAVIARELHLPQSQVHSVASFYSLISLKPLGRHVVRFCQDAPCHVTGGRAVWEALQEVLGIGYGETTTDGRWSLLTTSCIGACSVGPVMMVDDDIHGNLTPESVRNILARYDEVGGAA